MIATVVLFSASSSFAQVGSTAPRNASAINMTLPMSTRSVIPPIAGTVATPLGAIQFNLGVLGPNSGSPIGTITTCSTTGIEHDAEHYARCKQFGRGDGNAASATSSGRQPISRFLIWHVSHDGWLQRNGSRPGSHRSLGQQRCFADTWISFHHWASI